MSTNDTTARPGLFIPGLRALYEPLSRLSWPMVRIVTGLWMVPHGAQKLFGIWGGGGLSGTAGFFAKIGLEPALPLALLAGGTEFFGGLLLALGLFTRPAAAAAFILMIVATTSVHLANGFFLSNGGYEYALMWAVLALAVLFKGAGGFSLDARIGKEF